MPTLPQQQAAAVARCSTDCVRLEWSAAGKIEKAGMAISGTDVTHFFSLSPKVGQWQADCSEISVGMISNGSPAGFSPEAPHRTMSARPLCPPLGAMSWTS
jgi:hypothetical protein